MPLAFIAIGAVFLVAAVRGTVLDYTVTGGKVTSGGSTPGLITLIKSDFTGSNNFLIWILALWVLGALGYIPGFKPIANALLVLVVVVMVISNDNKTGGGGFFTNLENTIKGA
jgi:hypothetical protein